jgi:hypothetical protein
MSYCMKEAILIRRAEVSWCVALSASRRVAVEPACDSIRAKQRLDE